MLKCVSDVTLHLKPSVLLSLYCCETRSKGFRMTICTQNFMVVTKSYQENRRLFKIEFNLCMMFDMTTRNRLIFVDECGSDES